MTDQDVIGALRHALQILAGIQEAHALGFGPKPPGSDLVNEVAPALIGSAIIGVPDRVARSRAEWATDVARFMTARGSPPGVEDAWMFVTESYARLAEVYTVVARDTVAPDPGIETVEVAPVYTLDYQSMGRAVDAAIVARFHDAAEAILVALDGRKRVNPLSPEEIDLVRRLVDGRPVSDLAAELSRSDRSIYRALRNIWIRVGASSRNEGVAIITARGWLDPPTDTDSRSEPGSGAGPSSEGGRS